MKTLAMLGGMSYESTLVYYQLINQEINKRLGGSHSAKLLIYSFDYSELETYLEQGKWDQIQTRLTEEVVKLKHIGAEGFMLCANTMHLVAEGVQKEVDLPLIHIAKETMKEVKRRGIFRVGLIGTIYTMQSRLYDDIAASERIELVKPELEQQHLIHQVIYQELIVGKMNDESRKKILKIIDDLQVDGIILGCTELPILIKEDDLQIARFDTMAIHAKKAALWMLGEEDYGL